jgi:hypothetical protein
MSPKKKVEEVVNGIYLDPVPITQGDEVKIKYKGHLAEAGADKVFLHAGYGHERWENVIDIPMKKTRDGSWSITVQVNEPSNFNFCFRDSAQNWDNNQGRNWSYQVHSGDQITH